MRDRLSTGQDTLRLPFSGRAPPVKAIAGSRANECLNLDSALQLPCWPCRVYQDRSSDVEFR